MERDKKGRFVKGHPPNNFGRGTFKKGHPGYLKHANQTSFRRIWNGTVKEYKKLHYWVLKNLGRPQKCESCGTQERLEWANKSQQYKQIVSDWVSLCRKCHVRKDSQFTGRIYEKI